METIIKNTPFVEGTDIGINEVSVTYVQAPDTNSDEYQYLKISTSSVVGTDYPFYYDLSLPEEGHWSIDSIEDLKLLLEDFEKRVKNENTK